MKRMGLDKGHKLKDVTKTGRFEVRLTPEEMADLEQCAKALNTTKAGIVSIGIQMVKRTVEDSANKK